MRFRLRDVGRFLVATRGNPKLLKFAFSHAAAQQAEVLVLFIRHVAVHVDGARTEDLAVDTEAHELEQSAGKTAGDAGVPWKLLYTTATDVPDALLDIAVTHGVEAVIIGACASSCTTGFRAMECESPEGQRREGF